VGSRAVAGLSLEGHVLPKKEPTEITGMFLCVGELSGKTGW
jgi:hypothetical protein